MNIQLKQSTTNQVKITCLNGYQAKDYFTQIAQIRITMFRDFPYLYQGNIDYEKDYLDRTLCERVGF